MNPHLETIDSALNDIHTLLTNFSGRPIGYSLTKEDQTGFEQAEESLNAIRNEIFKTI